MLNGALTNVGQSAPAGEHLKEHAEFAVAEVREAARVLDAQLARVAMQWRWTHPELARQQVHSFMLWLYCRRAMSRDASGSIKIANLYRAK